VNWIGMNGAEPSLQELTAGGLDFVCCSLPEARSRLQAEQLRCLGVMAEKRLVQFPDVRTFKELGLDCATAGWRGIALPKGTPAAIVEKLADALHRVIEDDQFRQFMAKAGFSITWKLSHEFAESLDEGDVRFGKLLRSEAFQSIRRTSFGPYFFPSLLSVLALVVGGALLVTGNLKTDAEVAAISRQGLIRVAEIVAWVVLYLAIVETVGFVLTAAGLTLLLLVRLGTRWPVAAVVSIVVVPLAYHVFAVALRVPLPRGWLGW
jgi:hypothetical protein